MDDRNYYEFLSDSPHPWRKSGWRNRLEQIYRFEVALSPLRRAQHRPMESLLDVGSGHGCLFAHLQSTQARLRYTGLDISANAVQHARQKYPAASWIEGDFLNPNLPEMSFDAALAVGTMVFGHVETTLERQERLRALLRLLQTVSRRYAAAIMIDQNQQVDHPALSLEPALQGGTAEEAKRILGELKVNAVIRSGVLGTDIAVLLFRSSTEARSYLASLALEGVEHEVARTLASEAGQGASHFERAWLYTYAGLFEQAQAHIDRWFQHEDERWTLLQARLEQLKATTVSTTELFCAD